MSFRISNSSSCHLILYRARDILEPFAIAANITQGPTTRLYHVLLTLGNLYRIYSDPRIPLALRTGIHESLEKRWKKADQDLFIAGVVLNPYICDRCFTRNDPALTRIGLFDIMERLYRRILRKEPDHDFYTAFMDYLQDTAEFSSAYMHLDTLKRLAEKNVRHSLQ